MKINQALFAGSSTRVSGKPSRALPEFAFIGRSNVGKSSLINMLCSNGKLAMTSSTPGKTRVVNHFIINDKWYLVDLPGYGYARMSRSGRDELGKVIGDYIRNSKELVLLLVLVDSRHDITKIDVDFLDSVGAAGIPCAIVYTKCDKQGPGVLAARLERNADVLLSRWEELPPVFCTSSKTGKGREELLGYVEGILKTL